MELNKNVLNDDIMDTAIDSIDIERKRKLVQRISLGLSALFAFLAVLFYTGVFEPTIKLQPGVGHYLYDVPSYSYKKIELEISSYGTYNIKMDNASLSSITRSSGSTVSYSNESSSFYDHVYSVTLSSGTYTLEIYSSYSSSDGIYVYVSSAS